MLFHCSNGCTRAPQCYVSKYIDCLVSLSSSCLDFVSFPKWVECRVYFCVRCSSWPSLSQWPLYQAFPHRNKAHLISNKILVLLPLLFFIYLFFLSFHPSHFLSLLYLLPSPPSYFFCLSPSSCTLVFCFSPYCLPHVLVCKLFVSAFFFYFTFHSSVVSVTNVPPSNKKALHILNFPELAFQWI